MYQNILYCHYSLPFLIGFTRFMALCEENPPRHRTNLELNWHRLQSPPPVPSLPRQGQFRDQHGPGPGQSVWGMDQEGQHHEGEPPPCHTRDSSLGYCFLSSLTVILGLLFFLDSVQRHFCFGWNRWLKKILQGEKMSLGTELARTLEVTVPNPPNLPNPSILSGCPLNISTLLQAHYVTPEPTPTPDWSQRIPSPPH